MFFLIGNLYSSQMELRQNADARLVRSEKHVPPGSTTFLMSAGKPPCGSPAAKTLPIISVISISECLSIWAFRQSGGDRAPLSGDHGRGKYQGQPAYQRLTFFDRDGIAQVMSARPACRGFADGNWPSRIPGSTRNVA